MCRYDRFCSQFIQRFLLKDFPLRDKFKALTRMKEWCSVNYKKMELSKSVKCSY